MLRRTQPLNQLADRLFAVGDRSQAANLAIRLGYGNGKRLGMDIQSQKSYLFLHDRFLSACGSELCFLPESQPNPRSAYWAGHSILTRWQIRFKRIQRVATGPTTIDCGKISGRTGEHSPIPASCETAPVTIITVPRCRGLHLPCD